MHKIAILALHDFIPYDLGIACDVFEHARLERGENAYSVQVCGLTRTVRSRYFEMRVAHGLAALLHADTILVPGVEDPMVSVPEPVLAALREASQRGARLASICTGAFVLAASGLLDGRHATSHWLVTAKLAALYPKITVEPDVLFVDEGRIITSAGDRPGSICVFTWCVAIMARLWRRILRGLLSRP